MFIVEFVRAEPVRYNRRRVLFSLFFFFFLVVVVNKQCGLGITIGLSFV